jgi:hypothetical protein
MTRKQILWALAALNAVLLVALSWRLGGENVAHAQRAARGEYIMVPARLTGANNGVIYMIDTRNGLLAGFAYDNNKNDFITFQPINLQRFMEAGGGAIQPNRNAPRK